MTRPKSGIGWTLRLGTPPSLSDAPASSCQERARPPESELLGDALPLAPGLQESGASARVALGQQLRRADPVGAEVAEVAAGLAPGGEDAGPFEEAERHRPDHPLRRPAAPVDVAEAQPALGA